MGENCIFCKIANGVIPADKVFEDEKLTAFRDIAPKAPVHVIFIPKKHIATLNDIDEKDVGLLGHILEKIRETAVALGIAKTGYRVVLNCNKDGGQEVFHLHFHLLGGRNLAWPPG